ncbi:uncharacterized protein EI90DRAFT_3127845 [Cantharellus anzutake]|uniref:uncharacterized protein n=1 Tax=Cantharellus anzutake TaxID=1750568 RepID=UPI0019044C08|nr:uncharacterized protein EI90DRAFT_3127845 [Cantharellus anzutake]KAF8326690.1 hypothetical protein EI90DRAFT_3127845 [Cantharellus anzutake]
MSTSLYSAFVSKVSNTPGVGFLGLGLASSSFFFFGNIANFLVVLLPATTKGRDHKNAGEVIKQWVALYRNGVRCFVPSSVIGTLSFLAAGLLSESPTPGSPGLRPLLFAAAAVAVIPFPWTVLTMLPINNRLLALHDRFWSGDEQVQLPGEVEEKEALQLVEKWRKLHLFRIAVGFLTWELAVVAAFLA